MSECFQKSYRNVSRLAGAESTIVLRRKKRHLLIIAREVSCPASCLSVLV